MRLLNATRVKTCYNLIPKSMDLEFSNLGPSQFDEFERTYSDLLVKTFNHLNIKDEYEVDVSIVDNARIHEINKEYRGIDRPTDVISFAFYDDENELLIRDNPHKVLGEIIISYERATEQASDYGHTLYREMSFLFVHGLLHLLGYDHMKKEDEAIMFGLQDEILGEVRNMFDKELLLKKANEARKLSYSPYSHFAVGAALLTKDNKIFLGANIENSSYPLCMCAERNALYNAMLNGYKKDDFVALALSAATPTPCSPCGACRQVISELFPKDAPILMSNVKGDVQETTIAQLLPFAFSEDDLK